MNKGEKILAVDLGGTNVSAACVQDALPLQITKWKTSANGTVEQVMQQLSELIDSLVDDTVNAIGMGVPGMVDKASGMVYDVQHIPSWKEVNLQKQLQQRYNLPAMIDNDANCFALGEQYFGSEQNAASLIGLTIGTGLGAGIVINKKIYAGATGGAGEFGIAAYLDHNFEYYASGRFFQHVYQKDGLVVYEEAQRGEAQALKMYKEFGSHLGNAIKTVIAAYDPEVIVLGGAVTASWRFFCEAMWEKVNEFPYARAFKQIKILPSKLQHSGILGAAALHYQ
jgi:glucokinase